ncbi:MULTISPECIES: ArsR/SmtB family transcription factor [Paenibacillus]|uniref:Transcriptional regulator n=1 Tax=Paenibacillus azoreducens TaxID=116718 RepID=A0A920CTA7_9BACL|nr:MULTISPECIES: winged helix-turn-helix domain-containing protein [Paenibacillus]MBE9917220.1 winged helix-turn-helix transcriptional regulator [Paenibacillus donghaensis]GIO48207.1 transcriptional regulator [Paenibacillus azoreducens]
MKNEQPQSVEISVEQAKLLGSAQRIKIIGALVDTAKTSKQVADELGESPGSIHYHIQKLYDGGLIDLVETRTVGGIVEKYYKSKAKWFNTRGTQLIDPVLADDYEAASSTKINLRMQLSPEQREEMMAEFRSLLEKWVAISSASKMANSEEYAVGIKVVSTENPKNKA